MKTISSIYLIIKTYLLSVSIFFVFRVILFFNEIEKVNLNDVSIYTIIQAFIMGLRFDTVIAGYILIIPAILLFVVDILNANHDKIKKFIFYWTFVLFSISFFICAVDIPYFHQFYERLSVGALGWFDHFDFVVLMVFQEKTNFIYLFLFLTLTSIYYFLLKKIFSENRVYPTLSKQLSVIFSVMFLLLILLGIRGRISFKSPIRVGTAYFSENSFLNKLGLNPAFTFLKSYLESKSKDNIIVRLIDDATAEIKIKEYLHISQNKYPSPIARDVIPDTNISNKPNIVLIIMESMSAAKMKRFGNSNNLTPFLDSLSECSLFFENFYSAGKHTFNGVFSTLFSFPALYRQHPMKQIRKYDGISSVLRDFGYTTTFFTTHDAQFDNMEGFLRENDFQNIISQADYPLKEIKTTLGVPDDYMFKFSIPVINQLYHQNQPFFVAFLTASDHQPYYIPEYFHPKNKEPNLQIVEYADWSLKQFIKMASQQKWFDNTIFVFVADHGAYIDAQYDIAMNYFHIPLIIYAPKLISKYNYKDIGSQIDLFPTLMGILKNKYVNNTLGIDLLKEKRKYAIVNDDDKIGIIDSSYLCIMKDNGSKIELYHYKNNDKKNYYDENKAKGDEMAEYAKVCLQITQNMILKKQTSVKKTLN
ncbi:MAG TPA: sulfatase-like hydrolase/transferase [Bacteroidia bacterium]|nr:sulfatase-like hydrolase/transferase [Bacteroidia bacterium]